MTDTLPASKTTAKIAKAATAFVKMLTPEQKQMATFNFTSQERQQWQYIPKPRNGLPRGDLNTAQLDAAENLMASSLSLVGLEKAQAIIQHELILGSIDKQTGLKWFKRTPNLYFFSIFGSPGTYEPWGWRIEGHHLSLNITVINGELISTSPCFFGANPAEVKHGPAKGLRILQPEEDLARKLFLSLEPRQIDMALIYPTAPLDLITRASKRVEISSRVGVPAQLMSADQRKLLISLLKVYTGRVPEDVARIAFKRLENDGINEITFAWAGSEHHGQGHYYRIHGPRFFVEYDNTQDMANHIHSVWRDIDGDFGADLLQNHYFEDHI